MARASLRLSGFCCGSGGDEFFAVRLLIFTIYWSSPAHQNQPLEGWMTPRYVAHSYDIPPELVRDALNLEPGVRKRQTLSEIARNSGLTLQEMGQRINNVAETHHGKAQ